MLHRTCYHAIPQSSQSPPDELPIAPALPQSQRFGKEPRFLDQVAHACRVKHLPHRTEQSYVAWVKRIILFHNKRHPMEMGPTQVRAFLTHLAVNRRVSASTQNQALNAIVFLYRNVVGCDHGEIGAFGRAKRPKKLPTVLTRDEVKRVLAHLEGFEVVRGGHWHVRSVRRCWQVPVHDFAANVTVQRRAAQRERFRPTCFA